MAASSATRNWIKTYESNVTRAARANETVDAYHATLGWGQRELTVDVDPDLVLTNEGSKTIVIHDVTAEANRGHLAKGARYKSYFETKMPGYTVKYS